MRACMIGLLLLAGACDGPEPGEEAAEAPLQPAAITYDGADAAEAQAKLAHGERMSVVLGCKQCHGANLQGANVTDYDPQFGDMNAPNLTLLLAKYSDQDLDRVIRQGVPKDRREFWFMPSESFQYTSDADLSALTAYLRTVEPAGEQLPPIRKGPGFHELVKKGTLKNASALVERYKTSQPPDLGEQHKLGRYVAMTVCTECHNSELQGYEGFTPNLDLAGAYSHEDMVTLLTTGKGKAKPDLGLMTATAKTRFSRLTPRERDAVIAYVKARADRAQ